MRGLRDLIEWCGWWRCQTLANTGAADCTAARFAVRHALLGCVVVPVDSVHSSVQISEQQPWQCSALCALCSVLCALQSHAGTSVSRREGVGESGRERESTRARRRRRRRQRKVAETTNQGAIDWAGAYSVQYDALIAAVAVHPELGARHHAFC